MPSRKEKTGYPVVFAFPASIPLPLFSFGDTWPLHTQSMRFSQGRPVPQALVETKGRPSQSDYSLSLTYHPSQPGENPQILRFGWKDVLSFLGMLMREVLRFPKTCCCHVGRGRVRMKSEQRKTGPSGGISEKQNWWHCLNARIWLSLQWVLPLAFQVVWANTLPFVHCQLDLVSYLRILGRGKGRGHLEARDSLSKQMWMDPILGPYSTGPLLQCLPG